MPDLSNNKTIFRAPAKIQADKASWRWRCLALAGYVVLITWLLLAPARLFSPVPKLFPQADKLAHFCMFGGLVVVTRWVLNAGSSLRLNAFYIIFAAVAYGALMECLQWVLVSHRRSFDVADILANGAGAICFWGIPRLFFCGRSRSRMPD